jgi:hypothetical protein
MFHELLQAVREEASGERARATVAALSRFHRVQASPGYDEAATWLESALREDGLMPEREEATGDGRTRSLGVLMPRGWECSRALAVLHDGEARRPLCDYAEQRLSLVLRSVAAHGTFALRDVGEGVAPSDYEGRDVRGAVVLARGPAHRVHRLGVVERGAAGLLTDFRRLVPPARTETDERDAYNYTSFWWTELEPRGWGFVVTPEVGDELRARLAAGRDLAIEVEIESRDFPTRVPLVSTRIGPAGAPELLVTAHLCHPLPCANDNGSGVAAALETARVLASLHRRGRWSPAERAVRFLWMPELTGTHAWLAHDPRRASRLVAGLNLDMVGQEQEACGSTLLLEHPPCFAASFAEELLASIRTDALDRVGGSPTLRIAEVAYSGGSDHAVYIDPAIGVPCPLLIQWPDRFYHSSHDTVDHTDPRSLSLAVRCAATYAGFLAAAGPVEHDWLLGLVERGARRRWLEALDRADPAASAAREELRAEAALGSCVRLGLERSRVVEALERWTRFLAEQGGPRSRGATSGRASALVPRRLLAAPLDFQPHLWPGYELLPAAEREELHVLIERFPAGSTGLQVAWYACDGRRDLGAIAALVEVECGSPVAAGGAAPGAVTLERFFTLTERLGVSHWGKRPSS